jgi:ankyrin repeat protein
MIDKLLHQGANLSAADTLEFKTALHYAVAKNFRGVCRKLLENDARPNARDHDGDMPFTIAYKKGNDAIASMLIAYMSNEE